MDFFFSLMEQGLTRSQRWDHRVKSVLKQCQPLNLLKWKKNQCIVKEITILLGAEASTEHTWSKKMTWKWVKAWTRPNLGYFLSASIMFSDYVLFNSKDSGLAQLFSHLHFPANKTIQQSFFPDYQLFLWKKKWFPPIHSLFIPKHNDLPWLMNGEKMEQNVFNVTLIDLCVPHTVWL